MTRQRFSNRFARGFLGVAFAVIAFVIERRVIKAIKKGQLGEAKESPSRLSATTTGEGLAVETDESLF